MLTDKQPPATVDDDLLAGERILDRLGRVNVRFAATSVGAGEHRHASLVACHLPSQTMVASPLTGSERRARDAALHQLYEAVRVHNRNHFVFYLVGIGRYWAGLDGSNVPSQPVRGTQGRTGGLTHSLLAALSGMAGGLGSYKLAPKDDPGEDLTAHCPHEMLYAADLGGLEPPRARDLILQLRRRCDDYDLDLPDDLFFSLGHFLGGVLAWFESGFELRELATDDETGEVTGEGPNIAPGLPSAFTAQWWYRGGR